jgi:hypothetical protein
MNKKERLVAETFADHEGAAFAAAAAAVARRRRVMKHTALAGGIAAASAAAIFLGDREGPPPMTSLESAGARVEIISDQELVAQLKGQPVLYVKEHNRITGVVFPKTGEKL